MKDTATLIREWPAAAFQITDIGTALLAWFALALLVAPISMIIWMLANG